MFRSKLEEKIKGLGKMSPYIFITDTETTGFSYKMHDMITLSAEIRDLDFNLIDEIELEARPKSKERWDDRAEKIHGISYNEALCFDSARSESIKLLKFLKPFKHENNIPLLFVAHEHNKFDYNFLKAFYNNEGLLNSFFKVFSEDARLSTLKMAKDTGTDGNKLNQWAERIGFELNHHNAESDRKCCSELFKHLVETDYDLGIG